MITLLAALMVMAMALGASAAFAGEITGNGKVLKVDDSKWETGLHARSLCAYSGQEDDQFKDGSGDPLPPEDVVRGEPGHAQSWGQLSEAQQEIEIADGRHPGNGCNPNGDHG